MKKLLISSNNQASEIVLAAITDSYKRLLSPSLETEFTSIAKQKADEEAIKVFAENLRQLLLAPFLGRKRVLAIDPGFNGGEAHFKYTGAEPLAKLNYSFGMARRAEMAVLA